MKDEKHFSILGTYLTPSIEAKLYKIKKELTSPHSFGHVIFTPNSLILLRASKSAPDRRILNSADLLLPDGAGVIIASRFLGYPINKRRTGIDTAEELLAFAEKNSLSVFLLGGKKGVASPAAKNLKQRFPGLQIAGTHHGYFNKNGQENQKVIDMINRVSPDILFVCFGYPMQERWIYENKDKLHSVKLLMGLGGSLDVWSGRIKRAPIQIQKMNFEWLWRMLQEPRRIKDVALLSIFFIKVAEQKIFSQCGSTKALSYHRRGDSRIARKNNGLPLVHAPSRVILSGAKRSRT
ncbi:MAG: WecB/TagA/CpsF family glycosyltransferase [Clostridia bacterium]|nr:WecB/TagA/CpsF family glycosyltransferase [Clostridia bacterium]